MMSNQLVLVEKKNIFLSTVYKEKFGLYIGIHERRFTSNTIYKLPSCQTALRFV